jgi:GNAT superfamily N-acetyltransferase
VIRRATIEDVPRCAEMGVTFQRTSHYATLLEDNPAQIAALAARLVTSDHADILVAERAGRVVGMIALQAYTHHISGEWTAGELAFWVEPSARRAGLALLRAAEQWAADQGCRVLEMVSPDARVDRLYEALGYAPSERSYRKVVAAAGPPPEQEIVVLDDVLPNPLAYRAAALSGVFGTVTLGDDHFAGLAAAPSTVGDWLRAQTPTVRVAQSFFRQSPAGQQEPHYVHSDAMIGQWTGILYLTPTPPEGDGTAFFRHRDGAYQADLATLPRYAADFDDDDCWVRWWTVAARFNRLLLFPAAYFHARALRDNYGQGTEARLIQVLFGGYDHGDRDSGGHRAGDCGLSERGVGRGASEGGEEGRAAAS